MLLNKDSFPKLLFALVFISGFSLQSCKKNETADHAAAVQQLALAKANNTLNGADDNFTTINWGNGKSQPTSTHEINGEVVNNKLYVFGGHDYLKRPKYWSQTKRAYVYDPATNTWSAIADLPHLPSGANFGGVTNEGLTNDGTFIYFAGGYICNTDGTGQVFGTKQVWKYSTLANTYERLPDLPRALGVGQLKYLNGKLHFMGGADLSRNDVSTHYVLDLNNLANGWKTSAPLLNAVNQAGSVVFDGKIYLVGGARNHDAAAVPQKTLAVYDEATNKWKLLADMATARDHIASSVIVVGNRIIVLGGESSYNVTSKLVSAYTPSDNTWTELTQMPSARSGGIAALLSNNIYYTGGNFSVNNYKGSPVVSATETQVQVLEDAYTRDGAYASVNYGQDTALVVKGATTSGYARAAYLKFSIGAASTFTSVKLRLFGANADNATAIDLSCFALSSNDWSETGITFKNAPLTQQPALSLARADATPKYVDFDITNFVKDQLAANATTISLLIKDASGKNSTVMFKSKDASANKPQLIYQ